VIAVRTRSPPKPWKTGRSGTRDLGLERRVVDAVFRACPVVALPGYSRPVLRVRDYLVLLEESTQDGRTRVRL
jgi:hypothetical protein